MESYQIRLPGGEIVDSDKLITYSGAFEEVTLPAWQLPEYLRKETERWINECEYAEAVDVVERNKAGMSAILSLFGRDGYDTSAKEIWDALPADSDAKIRAAYEWMWDKYRHGWEMHDFKGGVSA